jgi:hypothetical protein
VVNGVGNVESPGNTCAMNSAANQVSVSATHLALGALADNGGPTQTQLPGGGSFAIDAGTNCDGADQRGLVRNVGACDTGAVEVGATLLDALFAADFEL